VAANFAQTVIEDTQPPGTPEPSRTSTPNRCSDESLCSTERFCSSPTYLEDEATVHSGPPACATSQQSFQFGRPQVTLR